MRSMKLDVLAAHESGDPDGQTLQEGDLSTICQGHALVLVHRL